MTKLIKFYGHQYCFNVFHKLLKYYEMIIMKKTWSIYKIVLDFSNLKQACGEEIFHLWHF